MPIKSNIDSSNELTEHVATGVVTDEEMFACQNKFYETVITRLELAELKNLVSEIDPSAFIAIENVHEVSGGQFKKKKTLLQH